MPTLATTVDGLKMPNPFVIGSGPPGTNLNVISRAFFIRPIHEANGDRRLAAILRIDAAKNLHAGHDVEAAVQPAAVRHGIHVAADEQALFGFTVQRRPKISGGVGVDFDRQIFEFILQPRARLHPHRGEGNPLRAIIVAGEGAKFFQLGNGPLWVQRWIHVRCYFSFCVKLL